MKVAPLVVILSLTTGGQFLPFALQQKRSWPKGHARHSHFLKHGEAHSPCDKEEFVTGTIRRTRKDSIDLSLGDFRYTIDVRHYLIDPNETLLLKEVGDESLLKAGDKVRIYFCPVCHKADVIIRLSCRKPSPKGS